MRGGGHPSGWLTKGDSLSIEQLWDLLIQVPLRQLRAWLPQQVGEGAKTPWGRPRRGGQKAEPGSRRPPPPAAPIQTRAFGATDARRGPETPGREEGNGGPQEGRASDGAGRAAATSASAARSPRPPPRAPSAAASRIAANCAPPPAAQGPRTGRPGPGAPAVIAAAAAAAAAGSASAPPPRLIGAASGGRAGAARDPRPKGLVLRRQRGRN